jgi:hypothetical protein
MDDRNIIVDLRGKEDSEAARIVNYLKKKPEVSIEKQEVLIKLF